MSTVTVECTPAQARYLLAKLNAKDAAAQDAQTALDALTAGKLPANGQLVNLDTDAGTLTFHVEQHGDSSAPVSPTDGG